MRFNAHLLLAAAAAFAVVHCAKGSDFVGDTAGGEGGSVTGGNGGAGPTGVTGTTSNGGTTSGDTSGATTTGSGTSTTGSGSTTTGSGSTSSTSGPSSSSSSGSTSSSGNVSSSSGGPSDCDPMNPGPVCGASQHCFPEPDGIPLCQGPVGPGGNYSACASPSDCQAALNCIDTGDIFASPCCLTWCTSVADCPGGSTCEFLLTPVYVGGTEYGVCYDGLGGC